MRNQDATQFNFKIPLNIEPCLLNTAIRGWLFILVARFAPIPQIIIRENWIAAGWLGYLQISRQRWIDLGILHTMILPRPRAATSVAVIIGLLPLLNSARTQSLSAWFLSPWMDKASHPSILNCLVTWSQPFFVSMNIRIRLPSISSFSSLISLHRFRHIKVATSTC